MTLPQQAYTTFIADVLSLIIAIYFAIQIEKYARKKWMQASARKIIVFSAVMIAIFGTLLLAAIIIIGLKIGGKI